MPAADQRAVPRLMSRKLQQHTSHDDANKSLCDGIRLADAERKGGIIMQDRLCHEAAILYAQGYRHQERNMNTSTGFCGALPISETLVYPVFLPWRRTMVRPDTWTVGTRNL